MQLQLNRIIKILIILSVVINALGLFFPGVSSTFIPWYGSIAKHIAVSGNWSDLVFNGQDWLDKPHFPFWASALSFNIFGINAFAYILPGFIFHLIGAFYTYKIARFWYEDNVACLALLIYVSLAHLLVSSIDVRAEAYLLGEIMPACYYWLCFDREGRTKNLLLAAIFTALALMTKGVFVLITIISGVAVLWMYRGQWRNFVSVKWLGALALSVAFTTPELWALYQQFDMHPDKIIYGHAHVSGIKWYFWDSQFGRFFNTGPLHSTNTPELYVFYYVHTFFWAFLPWWPVFFAAIWAILCKMRHKQFDAASIYLMSSFFITFAIFSMTSFQVDHYTNIIFPFAAIICAKWLVEKMQQIKTPAIYYVECTISFILFAFTVVASFYLLSGVCFIAMLCILVLVVGVLLMVHKQSWQLKILVYPILAICSVFTFATLINGVGYAKFDAGYQSALYLNQQQVRPIIGYKVDLLSLDLYNNSSYRVIDNLDNVGAVPSYMVIRNSDLNDVQSKCLNVRVLQNIAGTNIRNYFELLLRPQKAQELLDQYLVIQVN